MYDLKEVFDKTRSKSEQTTFKEFFDKKQSKSEQTTKLANSLMTTITTFTTFSPFLNLSLSKKEKFCTEVSELVHSDDFLDEFSKVIDKPKDNESEDEFVDRAKRSMKSLLMKKLSK
jgi:hypothetical protein